MTSSAEKSTVVSKWFDLADPRLSGVELSGIREVSVPGNQISDISREIGWILGCENLEILDLENNQIESIDCLSVLQNLQKLNVADNSIARLSGISGLSRLTELVLCCNSIDRVNGENFSALNNLTYLDFSANKISDISGACFSGLTSLTELYLDDNQICEIPDDAGEWSRGLTRLQRLNLSGNKIETIKLGSFVGLEKNLKILSLAFNNIKEIYPGISHLKNLTTLSIRYNNLSEDQVPLILENFPNLKDLNF